MDLILGFLGAMTMKKQTILICSRNSDFSSQIKSFLIDMSIEVVLLADGRQLTLTIQSVNPEFILLDSEDTDPCIIDQFTTLGKAHIKIPILLLGSHDEKLLQSIQRIGTQHNLFVFILEKKLIDKQSLLEKLQQVNLKHHRVNEESITAALENKEFLVFYQPKVAIKTRKLMGVEALIRWQKPKLGMIYPDEFIPIAEQSGLIIPLTYWVIKEVFRQYKVWKKAGIHMKYAINLTPSLLTDTLFPGEACKLANEYEVNTSDICFEITETAAMKQVDTALEILTRFRLSGFALSIDDFGTGYSSLLELQRLPFNEMKVDKSFVIDIAYNTANHLITRSIIDLGHNMNMSLVAEGVETSDAWAVLEKLDCDIAQGYLTAKPLSVKDFEEWYKQHVNKDGIYDNKDWI